MRSTIGTATLSSKKNSPQSVNALLVVRMIDGSVALISVSYSLGYSKLILGSQ
jgi:hypothetical protein